MRYKIFYETAKSQFVREGANCETEEELRAEIVQKFHILIKKRNVWVASVEGDFTIKSFGFIQYVKLWTKTDTVFNKKEL